jgi:ketol-acid reductoisomerase
MIGDDLGGQSGWLTKWMIRPNIMIDHMARIYYDEDADLTVLDGKRIGFVGYGNQGRAQALNMRDSGIKDILIGTARDASFDRALEDGFQTMDIKEMISRVDIIFMVIPDEIMPRIYEEQIAPHLTPGSVLNFSSGYNITFRQIIPPPDVDVILVAPRMIGDGVRNLFLNGEGYMAFVGIEQDATGKSKQTALALAKAIGATKCGSIEVTFRDETMMDLLAEQAIWPMIISIITEAFSFEVEKGHPAEASLLEKYICKEPAYMFEKMAEYGLYGQMPFHSHTSQYGQYSRAEALDKSFIRKTLENAYAQLENGVFAWEWKAEQEKGLPEFKRLQKKALHSDLAKLEEKLLKN